MLLVRLAGSCARRPRTVIAVWAAVVAVGILSAPALFGRLSPEAGSLDGGEAASAARAIWRAEPTGGEIYAVADGRPAGDPALKASVARVGAAVEALPGVTAVATPYRPDGGVEPRAVARDGRAVALAVRFDATSAGEAAIDEAATLLRTLDAPRVVVGGGELLDAEMEAQAAADLARAELLSMPVALVLLLVVFGGIVAAGLPVLVALVGVAATLASLAAISLVAEVSVYAVNIVTMLGLGLAVDYALLVVSRFREERAVDSGVRGALDRTYASAGRTVAFSGLTVAASLGGLLVFPDDFLRSMGFAGLSVVLLDLVAAVTLLPALLAVVGHRIRPARAGARDGRTFARIAGAVRRRPVVIGGVVAGLLITAAVPFLDARYADPDARSLPPSAQSRMLSDIADARFDTDAQVDPVTVVMRGSVPAAALQSYVATVEAIAGVREVKVRDLPGLTVVDAVPEGETQGATAMRLVEELRRLPSPLPAQVGGDAAQLRDYQDALVQRLPWAFALMVGATFVLLFLFTGSVVVPVKAVLLNVLSLGASFGALVWVFQQGHLGGLVGTQALGSLSVTTPVLVFAIAFGLSMDYEVFLLGRIAEAYRRTGDNDSAISWGLQRTGSVVTAAAVLMVVVFAGFVAGGFSPVKQVGLGLALAIVVDATLVRMLLVPAVMSLMGSANWWAPGPLRRLHRRIGLSEDAEPPITGRPVAPEREPVLV